MHITLVGAEVGIVAGDPSYPGEVSASQPGGGEEPAYHVGWGVYICLIIIGVGCVLMSRFIPSYFFPNVGPVQDEENPPAVGTTEEKFTLVVPTRIPLQEGLQRVLSLFLFFPEQKEQMQR